MIKTLNNIHPSAQLGKEVCVGNFTTIEEDVIIGDNTSIGPHVTIMAGARIGSNCQIFPGVVIAAVPQDLKFKNKKTHVEIGNYTIIREYVTINRGTLGATIIGSNVLLMAYVHIAHDCIIGDQCIIANATQIAGHVHIDHHTVLGGKTSVHQFIRIGPHAMVASGTTIRKDIPPFIRVAREPIHYCGINTIGLQRSNFTTDTINRLKNIYHIIYQQGLPLQKALTFIKNNFKRTEELVTILDFIEKRRNGIVKKVAMTS